jgi:GMP synthase (glutamine-hydrolysing)
MAEKIDTILILDFGGQYCHLIGRRIRENNVYSEILPFDIPKKEIEKLEEKFNIKGLILSGGPSSVYEKDAPLISKEILELPFPILGLCYGHQLIAYLMGGKVKPAKKREYGITLVEIKKPAGILKNLRKKEKIWMSHGDIVLSPPPNFEVLAKTENCPVAAISHQKKPIFGIQWHPEVSHTEKGVQIFKNFIFDICHCQKNWRPAHLIERLEREIKEKVGKEKAIVALSGGIDSSCATVLASKVLEKNLTAVFVDHGLLRENEAQQVKETFKKIDLNFVALNEKKRFLRKLKGVENPEKKRKIIGQEFIRVFEKVAKGVKANYLIQGTIYPDRIEAGYSRKSEKIKTHHNVAGLPSKIKFKAIIEPLKDFYKDEVREIAKKIGLPEEIIFRQPFPGPGLGVRIMGEVTEKRLKILKKADTILREEIEKEKLTRNLWQYFAVLLDTKTTGVKGDKRAYGQIIALRIVESREAMTANFVPLPYQMLEKVSTRITNEISEIVRVVYDITHKPPSTIEWE